MTPKPKIAVILNNIRSAHNVGSIFRTADGAGVSHLYLVGYTPLPTDTFGRPQKEIAKTALGAEKVIPWTHHTHLKSLVTKLKKEGWHVVGVEQDARAKKHTALAPLKRDTVFVLGNEVLGLSKQARDLCDELVEIPMHGAKESLNVSVAAGIVLFAAL